ncbi:MAG: hypothetical protein ACJ735_14090 [Actinomycetes bacterium]
MTRDRLLLISADCHAGGTHEMYRDYLESRYHDQFDVWRSKYRNPFRDLTADAGSRNWDDDRRVSDLEATALQAIANRVGPTVGELREPFDGVPDGNRTPAFTRLTRLAGN